MRIYVASPFGFSEAGRVFLETLERQLSSLGHEILSPWGDPDVLSAFKGGASVAQIVELVGSKNARHIASADCVLACLDGMEPDSGTSSEVGFAAGIGKRVYGLRTDFRDCGDFPGVPLNVQLLYFIAASGGRLLASLADLSTIGALDSAPAD